MFQRVFLPLVVLLHSSLPVLKLFIPARVVNRASVRWGGLDHGIVADADLLLAPSVLSHQLPDEAL